MDDPSLSFTAAAAAFAALDRQRVAGQITEQTYKEALNALRVKDNEGYTWMLQERTGNWYVYRDGTWSPGTPPVQESAGPPGPPPPPTAAEPISNASEVPHPYASPPQGFPPRVGVAPASESPVSAYPAGAPQAAFPPPVPPATNPVPAAPYANTAAYAQAAAYTPPVDPSALEKNPRSAQTRSKEARRERRAERRPGCLKITWSILKWEILWAAAGWLAYDALGQRYPWIVIPVGLLALLFMLRYLRRFRRTAIEGAA